MDIIVMPVVIIAINFSQVHGDNANFTVNQIKIRVIPQPKPKILELMSEVGPPIYQIVAVIISSYSRDQAIIGNSLSFNFPAGLFSIDKLK